MSHRPSLFSGPVQCDRPQAVCMYRSDGGRNVWTSCAFLQRLKKIGFCFAGNRFLRWMVVTLKIFIFSIPWCWVRAPNLTERWTLPSTIYWWNRRHQCPEFCPFSSMFDWPLNPCAHLRRKFPENKIEDIFHLASICKSLTSFGSSVNVNPISVSFGTLNCILKFYKTKKEKN